MQLYVVEILSVIHTHYTFPYILTTKEMCAQISGISSP